MWDKFGSQTELLSRHTHTHTHNMCTQHTLTYCSQCSNWPWFSPLHTHIHQCLILLELYLRLTCKHSQRIIDGCYPAKNSRKKLSLSGSGRTKMRIMVLHVSTPLAPDLHYKTQTNRTLCALSKPVKALARTSGFTVAKMYLLLLLYFYYNRTLDIFLLLAFWCSHRVTNSESAGQCLPQWCSKP